MCAIVGIINSKDAAKTAYYGLFSMQHRGQEASGISASNNHNIKTIKNRGLVTEVFNHDSFEVLKGEMAIGHNRYSTAGSDSVLDAQPVSAKYSLGQISIVHNGNLINKNEVRERLVEDGAIFQSNMDTENILHLIAKSKKEHLQDRIVEAVRQIIGAYCLLILSRSKMFVLRDPYGVRPLSLGRLKDGGYIVASETCAFDLVGATFIRDVKPGEMLIFEEGKSEFKSIQLFGQVDPRICAFEYIYFARPDSVIDGKNVYDIRKKLGETLAKKSNIKADFVVPVPDSGVPAALGYSQFSKIPFEMAIVRNHYVGRTFIEPTQEMRNLKVKLKLNPMSSVLNGKSVVVIDDSIVRGTTSKKIVELLRHAGVKEIHMKIAAPEIKHPCRYGIDTPSYAELISANMNVEEVRKFIGADSLEFLSIDELTSSLGNERKYSLVSFDGDYFIK
ncbi:amidophosphoribosyltransferase [Campylobacter fetus]|uniref:Amidophosphoribosyltransferase n=3 Tax=Campylobacter fetus TaxID=196 RepID=A0A5L4IE07_CAMFE|nr:MULTISPECIES: amidophosphoribosyltransferase [Campylobacter]OCS22999.1 amidophosphoribosyltransferase [Campylobacter fetus subsp. venerealis cfvi97/532]OCS27194.1 amidophosphoribosyltransferase [Campylobacter fetus subsp. venerealis cfvB10]OCS30300.1 amidophosphoribosyltransferase [Campylobacter fetus subsp. venerealis LMG 6570 = CCUG 33900]OCS40198.1 amidophosphoribosyltransferase [Campylobacter fetus subsp. venerealis cfvi02/298]ABK82894.1 amidophosphoribosyltransferase [Campylobacter fet